MEQRNIRLLEGEALWTFALKALGGRAQSSGELRERLRRRAKRADEVEQVMARLKELGYLNDQGFAEGFAGARLREKFGRTRVTQELRRRAWKVNPKRVNRLMREDNLLCVRKRKFVVTTDSNHGKKVYPNLARKMVLTDVDQLWVADLTYIRLREEFVFLAVILDAHSRRVIGWALDRTIEDDLTLRALRMALAQRVIEPGLVHHSDRGSQYASRNYTDLLHEHGIEISMSREGNPWDNAACESFMKTLKYEEVHRNEYRDLNEARSTIRIFLEKIYNQKRLHSAIGYVPPAEFETTLLTQRKEAATRQLIG